MLALGRCQEVIADLNGLIAEEPQREHPRAQLMRALHHSGRRVEALEAYRSFRGQLVDELGVEPGAALREVHQRILRGEVAAGAAPAERHRERGDRRGESVGLVDEASALLALGEPDAAEECLTRALPLTAATGNVNLESIALVALARVQLKRTRFDTAAALLERARIGAMKGGFRCAEAMAHEALGRPHGDRGADEDAIGAHIEALLLAEESGQRLTRARALLALGDAYDRADGTGDADAARRSARELFEAIGLPCPRAARAVEDSPR
ncbi:AfsR/SARP family transcriptional regulator [Streptomyces cucumeris]|uniref:AfsR/SARP family transcriptional regulator n=1 Tax=Streptomyces cucumeris TaxID=2962890 RepID=UPI003D74432B